MLVPLRKRLTAACQNWNAKKEGESVRLPFGRKIAPRDGSLTRAIGSILHKMDRTAGVQQALLFQWKELLLVPGRGYRSHEMRGRSFSLRAPEPWTARNNQHFPGRVPKIGFRGARITKGCLRVKAESTNCESQ
jgi:hypothetical protein